MVAPKDLFSSLSHERLISLLSYDKDSGLLLWLRGNRKGKTAGHLTKSGYVHVTLKDNNEKRREYYAHRLIWYHVTGNWPVNTIDHINRTRNDNRWINLREATISEQKANTSKVGGVSKYKGITYEENKWRARIYLDGKRVSLGKFETEEEAKNVYEIAAKRRWPEFYAP